MWLPLHPLPLPQEHYYQLPALASSVGLVIGAVRESRKAGLQYLAENAHRAPRTVVGWYQYKRVKNYKMMLAGLQGGGAAALKLTTFAGLWVAVEDISCRVGLADAREIPAGLALATAVSATYRAPTRQVFFLGFTFGLCKMCLRLAQAHSGTALNRPTHVDPEN